MGKNKHKKDANASGGGGVDNDAKREQPLQAVLLADSFINSFRPASLDRPKMLSPLNNVAMIEYSLDFLESTGVLELFVVCVSKQVEEYLQAKQQSERTAGGRSSKMSINVICDSLVTNAGDALRELDKRNVIESDPFLLMFGDTVTNVDVTSVLQAHKKRRAKDSRAIMTLLMKPIGPTISPTRYASIRSFTQDLIVGVDPTQENRVVVYDDRSNQGTVSVPCSFLAGRHHPYVELHDDWLDCGIDVCSPDVLARFSDEFDYRDLRKEFVANAVAEEEEGLQNWIYAHLLQPHEYAARVHDFGTYAAVSRDLLTRWCHPIVPDQPAHPDQPIYALQRHYMYHQVEKQTKIRRSTSKAKTDKSKVSRLARNCSIRGPGMMGGGCKVGDRCIIHASVIGDSCIIDKNVRIENSHLWDQVHVEQDATVLHSVLARGVIVKTGATVSRGCIIGAGCVVGENVTLPEFTRLSLTEEKEDDHDDDWDDDDDEEDGGGDQDLKKGNQHNETQFDHEVVGPDGKGQVWKPPHDDNDNDGGGDDELYLKAQSIGFDPTNLLLDRIKLHEEADPYKDLEDHENDGGADGRVADSNEMPGSQPLATLEQVIGRQEGIDVIKELKMICLEYESSSPIENLAIELNSFKFSQNATYSDCTKAAMLAILERMSITRGISNGKLVSEFKASLIHWAPLLEKMSIGSEEEKAMVLALEETAVSTNDKEEKIRELASILSQGTSFRLLLQTLHDQELVSEEAILAWATERRNQQNSGEDNPLIQLFQLGPIQDFIEWLEEEDEDDDEDEEDDDEDDE